MTNQYVEMYTHFATLATDTLMAKVAAIRDGIAAGVPKDELLAECGKESGDSRKQVAKFYAVAMVFNEKNTPADFDYWTVEVAATAPGVDPDDWTTHANAYKWIDVAVNGYDSKQGRKVIRRKHSARTLRRAIRAASAPKPVNPKPEVVFTGDAYIREITYEPHEIADYFVFTASLGIDLTKPHPIYALQSGDSVTLTITRSQPLPESDAGEGTVAA